MEVSSVMCLQHFAWTRLLSFMGKKRQRRINQQPVRNRSKKQKIENATNNTADNKNSSKAFFLPSLMTSKAQILSVSTVELGVDNSPQNECSFDYVSEEFSGVILELRMYFAKLLGVGVCFLSSFSIRLSCLEGLPDILRTKI